eukprot:3920823-Rhodomonas_salina.1
MVELSCSSSTPGPADGGPVGQALDPLLASMIHFDDDTDLTRHITTLYKVSSLFAFQTRVNARGRRSKNQGQRAALELVWLRFV